MLQIESIEALSAEVYLAACQTVSDITILAYFPIPQTAVLTFVASCCRFARDAVISAGGAGSLIGEISVHTGVADLAILSAGQAVGMGIFARDTGQSTQVETAEADALSFCWC